MWQALLKQVKEGELKALARSISLVENEYPGYEEFLRSLPVDGKGKIIGITGPPGAGKSTLTDGLIGELVAAGKKTAVLCVDPSSPFNLGAVLGDRIRMSNWYTHPLVFIRSLATRGSMGGLHPGIIEISEVVKAAGFDYIIIETVGVGQSEIEIAGLADLTVVVVVPEAGDEIQTMKAGLMEIADIFVVNKSDRPGADAFVKNLRMMLAPAFSSKKTEIPILKTVASTGEGIKELMHQVLLNLQDEKENDRKIWLKAERAYQLIQKKRMKDLQREALAEKLKTNPGENLFSFIRQF